MSPHAPRAAAAVAALALALAGCGDGGPTGPGPITMNPSEADYAPLELASLRLPLSASVPAGAYGGEIGGEPFEATLREDGTLLLLVPDIPAGTHALRVSFPGREGVARLAVRAAPSLGDPEATVRSWVGTIREGLDVLARELTASGDLPAGDLERMREASAAVEHELDSATEAELREAALFLLANPELFAFAEAVAMAADSTRGGTAEEGLETYRRYVATSLSSNNTNSILHTLKNTTGKLTGLVKAVWKWTNIGGAIDLVQNLAERGKNVFVLVADSIEADLEALKPSGWDAPARGAVAADGGSAAGSPLVFRDGVENAVVMRADYRTLALTDLAGPDELGSLVGEALRDLADLSGILADAASALGLESLLRPLLPDVPRVERRVVHPRYLSVEAVDDSVAVGYERVTDGNDPSKGYLRLTLDDLRQAPADREVTLRFTYEADGIAEAEEEFVVRLVHERPVAATEIISTSMGFLQNSPDKFSCGLATSGEAFCWGNGEYGQLGNGSSGEGYASSVPVPVSGGHRFRAVAAGAHQACAIDGGGDAWCWGHLEGDLGTGSSAVPVRVSGGGKYKAISAGGSQTCALSTDGRAYCWGYADGLTPAAVPGGLEFESIATNWGFTCGITTSADAYCWGHAGGGDLGDGSQTSAVPVKVSGGHDFVAISPGWEHACAITVDGDMYCWGFALTERGDPPRRMSGAGDFVAVSAGLRVEACGLTRDGSVYCWARFSGFPASSGFSLSRVSDLAFASISLGDDYLCGATRTGEGYCWGYGWPGDGSAAGYADFARVGGGIDFGLPGTAPSEVTR